MAHSSHLRSLLVKRSARGPQEPPLCCAQHRQRGRCSSAPKSAARPSPWPELGALSSARELATWPGWSDRTGSPCAAARTTALQPAPPWRRCGLPVPPVAAQVAAAPARHRRRHSPKRWPKRALQLRRRGPRPPARRSSGLRRRGRRRRYRQPRPLAPRRRHASGLWPPLLKRLDHAPRAQPEPEHVAAGAGCHLRYTGRPLLRRQQ